MFVDQGVQSLPKQIYVVVGWSTISKIFFFKSYDPQDTYITQTNLLYETN